MIVHSFVFDHVSTVSMSMATLAISWSWWTAIRSVIRPVEGALPAPSCLISGFGQA